MMIEKINPNMLLTISSGYRLQFETKIQKFVLLYPEGMVQLNVSASEILQLCDGTRNVDMIINQLVEKFGNEELRRDVAAFLEDAYTKGWIHGKHIF